MSVNCLVGEPCYATLVYFYTGLQSASSFENKMLRTFVIVCFYMNLVFAKNEYYIDDSNGFGRKFDGIGGISGGGVSSEEIKFRHQAISYFIVLLLAIMHTLYTFWPQTHTNSLGFKQFICLFVFI